MTSNLESMKLSQKFIISAMLDPWENIRSLTSELVIADNNLHKKRVCSYYNIDKKKRNGFCMVLGNVFADGEVICSHIWPSHMNGNFLESLGLSAADANNPRNFLRLNKSIEKAFDEKRLTFLKTPNKNENIIQLKIVILDPDLKDEAKKDDNKNYYFVKGVKKYLKDLHNKYFVYKFAPNRKPYLRLLAMHTKCAIDKARGIGWIPDDGQFEEYRTRNIELARLSLNGPGPSTVLDAFFN